MALLEIKELRLVYPNGHEALKNVSFSAEAGDIVAIIGRSGAGKSTWLRCINGLEKTTSGSIKIDNDDIAKLSQQQWSMYSKFGIIRISQKQR